jgi:membrane protein implicated in regulation of membrane protease activity
MRVIRSIREALAILILVALLVYPVGILAMFGPIHQLPLGISGPLILVVTLAFPWVIFLVAVMVYPKGQPTP